MFITTLIAPNLDGHSPLTLVFSPRWLPSPLLSLPPAANNIDEPYVFAHTFPPTCWRYDTHSLCVISRTPLNPPHSISGVLFSLLCYTCHPDKPFMPPEATLCPVTASPRSEWVLLLLCPVRPGDLQSARSESMPRVSSTFHTHSANVHSEQ